MPEIVVTLGGNVVSKYVFDKDAMSIGRSRDNDIAIENLAVSRNHARIRRMENSYILSDLNSANGTYVNGVRITKTEVFHDDVITIGKHQLTFKNVALSDEALISDAFGAERTVVVDTPPVSYLIVTRGRQKDMEFRIDKAEVTIGRSRDCDICVHDWFVSKEHAVIKRQAGTFLLRDRGSWRGTKVNEVQITETVLKDGDEIQMGGVRFLFRPATPEELAPPKGRVPLELEPSREIRVEQPEPAVAQEPVEEVVAAEEEEEEPIRAGGEEDFIEPAERRVREPVDVVPGQESAKGERLFADLDEELRESAEMIRSAVGEAGSIVEVTTEPPGETAPPAQQGPAEPAGEAEPADHPSAPSEVPLDEIRMWEEALQNKSPLIRKQAARMLKRLTGRDYDY